MARRCGARESFGITRGARVGSRFWREQSRAAAHDSAIRPILVAKEDFPLAGITVIPARHQPQMLAENILGAARYWSISRDIGLCSLRGGTFQVFAKNVFRGTWLPGDFGEANESGLGQPAAANGVNGDALVFRAALENHRIEILDAARQFR